MTSNMNEEQLNSVIDDLLQRLYKRWPNDEVSLCRYRNPRGQLLWIAFTSSQGQGYAKHTAKAAADDLLARDLSALILKQNKLRNELEIVDAALAALDP